MRRVLLEYNGTGDPVCRALARFLAERGVEVWLVSHPLTPMEAGLHRFGTWPTRAEDERTRRLPHHPPFTFPLDLTWPSRYPPTVDLFVGFTNLAAVKGLCLRAAGRADHVVYWGIDYTPNRFGRTSPISAAYSWLDRFVCRRVDTRVDLSSAMQAGRNAALRLAPRPGDVVAPVGVWANETPTSNAALPGTARLVYLGSLERVHGVLLLPEILERTVQQGISASLSIIGRGSERPSLEKHFARRGLSKFVTFHGFVADQVHVDDLLALGTIALAPYQQESDSFVPFADSGKYKAYLGAGLPIVTTRVSPFSAELERQGAAVLCQSVAELSSAVEQLSRNPSYWKTVHEQAMIMRKAYDWESIFCDLFTSRGLHLPPRRTDLFRDENPDRGPMTPMCE